MQILLGNQGGLSGLKIEEFTSLEHAPCCDSPPMLEGSLDAIKYQFAEEFFPACVKDFCKEHPSVDQVAVLVGCSKSISGVNSRVCLHSMDNGNDHKYAGDSSMSRTGIKRAYAYGVRVALPIDEVPAGLKVKGKSIPGRDLGISIERLCCHAIGPGCPSAGGAAHFTTSPSHAEVDGGPDVYVWVRIHRPEQPRCEPCDRVVHTRNRSPAAPCRRMLIANLV